MNSPSRIVPWVIWGILLMVMVSVVGIFVTSTLREQRRPLPIYGQIGSFALTNQFGQAVTSADFKERIWVANIIFTRCPGPCAQMSRQMQTLQAALPHDSSIQLVSLTADPIFDTPVVLRNYAARFQADSNRWQFLTGPKQEIYDLARTGLKLSVEELPEGSIEEQFIHSTRFVVVDGRGRVRDVSPEGTEAAAVQHIRRAVQRLLKEQS
jgi:protein SCO1